MIRAPSPLYVGTTLFAPCAHESRSVLAARSTMPALGRGESLQATIAQTFRAKATKRRRDTSRMEGRQGQDEGESLASSLPHIPNWYFFPVNHKGRCPSNWSFMFSSVQRISAVSVWYPTSNCPRRSRPSLLFHEIYAKQNLTQCRCAWQPCCC